jgi:hypothetical protein
MKWEVGMRKWEGGKERRWENEKMRSRKEDED